MKMGISADMRTSKGLAMALAPYDTGNLRFNAIKSIRTNNGFTIKYSLDNAFYIYFLEEGKGNNHKVSHAGFIGNNTVPTIASYLYSKYVSQDNVKTNRFKYVGRKSQNDFDVSEQRVSKNEQSLKLDVDRIARENKWKHDLGEDVYDSEFSKRSI